MPPFLLANLGGEERWSARRIALRPASTNVARLWSRLFGAGACLLDADPLLEASALSNDRPIWDFLPNDDVVCPWIVTQGADRRAVEVGKALWGSEPAIVRAVHDKKFAVQSAREFAAEFPAAGWNWAFDVLDVQSADQLIRAIAAQSNCWPDDASGRFTLKPRLGGSGRGRVPGVFPACDSPEIRGAMRRFARTAGVVLEPWLDRVQDFSAQFFVSRRGEVQFLGLLEQIMSESGQCLGHLGCRRQAGVVLADSRWDAAIERTSRRIVEAAAERGFWGVCGVDAFSYRAAPGQQQLRPAVEFNARFTLGTVALGAAARFADAPETAAWFALLYAPTTTANRSSDRRRRFLLSAGVDPTPVLLWAANRKLLDDALGALVPQRFPQNSSID